MKNSALKTDDSVFIIYKEAPLNYSVSYSSQNLLDIQVIVTFTHTYERVSSLVLKIIVMAGNM